VAPNKLTIPRARPGLVSKVGLARLPSAHPDTTLAISAPAGYGKTALMAQWAQGDGRRSIWISLDRNDNDVGSLLRLLADAVERLGPLGLVTPGQPAYPLTAHTARLFARPSASPLDLAEPVLLLVDDIDAVIGQEPREVLAGFIDHLPRGSTVAAASRARTWLSRASRGPRSQIIHIDRHQLALDADEATELLSAAGVTLDKDEAEELVQRTEGWPAGLYLGALALRQGPPEERSLSRFSGNDVFVADYLQFEVLDRLPHHLRRFLTRTAVLEELTAPLCDQLLGTRSSERTLALLRHGNVFLVPLEGRVATYRYHGMFRDLLGDELTRDEPAIIPELHRRAADWYEANGRRWFAVHHARAAGDIGRATRVIAECPLSADLADYMAPVEQWLTGLTSGYDESYVSLAVLAGWTYALTGRPIEAALCVDIAERTSLSCGAQGVPTPVYPVPVDAVPVDPVPVDPVPVDAVSVGPRADEYRPIESSLALLRSMMCVDGVGASLADAEFAVDHLPPSSPCRSGALMLLFQASQLAGDTGRAAAVLAEWVETAEGARDSTLSYALTERSLSTLDHGDWRGAAADLERALTWIYQMKGQRNFLSAITFAVSARVAAHEGDPYSGREYLAYAMRARRQLTCAMPSMAVELRLQLARAQLAFSDGAAARDLLTEIEGIFQHRSDLGVLTRATAVLRGEIGDPATPRPSDIYGLTPAELRLLSYLQTNLTYPEIAELLYVSKNTVKTQAKSIYLKLDVSSRGAAVELVSRLGLTAVQPHLMTT
jgi:LuxR family transcriptional regulator, maltose regulon positive regulatory protein